ncbi:hypothetical protein [Sphingomonas abietis]|uniref:Uncharacterized protein n=1 Tax=Sphingomonas abietis TaxID=3012344 RepID=A0ABY7NS77_9SPHN|nr:hypothetical protein [Sphingomonas abietis]WBO24228.1 hypothetical protein PBT88_09040 [Sphingomonas abietis]
MLKLMAAVCIIGGGAAAFYAASLPTGSVSRLHAPAWMYRHY